jgi:hypothetical protein
MAASVGWETVVSEKPAALQKPGASGKSAELAKSVVWARWYWNSATKYPR